MAVTYDLTGGLQKVKWTWTCSCLGAYSEATTNRFNGQAFRLITIPHATAPTTLYDITIKDADGVDVLNGLGADRSATVTEQKSMSDGLGVIKSSLLTLAVANAGDEKLGTVILYILDLDKGVLG